MRRLIDRLIIFLAVAMLTILAAGIAFDLLWKLGSYLLAQINSSWFGSLCLVFGLTFFFAGLVVRGVRVLTNPRGIRRNDRAAQTHQVRQAVRRPAPDVPVTGGRAIPGDRDPALGGELE